MLGKIAIGIILFIFVALWLMTPYVRAMRNQVMPAGLIIASWIFIPAYMAVTGVYFLYRLGLV